MSYENWKFHQEARYRSSMARAQAAYDAQMPSDDLDCVTPCPRCGGSGLQYPGEEKGPSCEECDGRGEVGGHDWHRLPGEAKDGTRFKKCRKCGLEDES